MAKKVVVNQEECIGCGNCAELCPTVFQLDEQTEKSQVIMPTGGPEDCIEDAIDQCPVSAISWQE